MDCDFDKIDKAQATRYLYYIYILRVLITIV
jgi:hypothetical protein